MSTEVSITVSFPLGGRFISNPEYVFYNQYIRFLKSLFCVSSDSQCASCPLRMNCRFYRLSGENFTVFPAVIIKSSYFTKKRYTQNEELIFRIVFIGNTEVFADSCKLFVKENLNQYLAGQFFCLKDYKTEQTDKTVLCGSGMQITSPAQSKDIRELFAKTIDYYNTNYETGFDMPEINIEKSSFSYQKRSGYRICGEFISMNGYIGTAEGTFIGIPKEIVLTGVGKNNCIGGGQFEIKNIIS